MNKCGALDKLDENVSWPSTKQSKKDPLKSVKFQRGAKQKILRTYVNLHSGKDNGKHWLWAVIERVANGENADSVLEEYGFNSD